MLKHFAVELFRAGKTEFPLNKMAKPGRKQFEPTDADRETVKHMASAGFKHEQIAKCLGDHGIDDKTLRKHFRRELDIAELEAHREVIGALRAAIKRGELAAVFFWCKTRLGWRETAVLEQNVNVKHSNAREEVESRLDRISARLGSEGSSPRVN